MAIPPLMLIPDEAHVVAGSFNECPTISSLELVRDSADVIVTGILHWLAVSTDSSALLTVTVQARLFG